MILAWASPFKVIVITSPIAMKTFVVAEITFDAVVITFLVVKITFVVAEITFKSGCDQLYHIKLTSAKSSACIHQINVGNCS